MVNRIELDAQLQDPNVRYRGRLRFRNGYAAVLTNITRRQLDLAHLEDEQELVLPPQLTTARTSGSRAYFKYSFGQKLALLQIERIR